MARKPQLFDDAFDELERGGLPVPTGVRRRWSAARPAPDADVIFYQPFDLPLLVAMVALEPIPPSVEPMDAMDRWLLIARAGAKLVGDRRLRHGYEWGICLDFGRPNTHGPRADYPAVLVEIDSGCEFWGHYVAELASSSEKWLERLGAEVRLGLYVPEPLPS